MQGTQLESDCAERTAELDIAGIGPGGPLRRGRTFFFTNL